MHQYPIVDQGGQVDQQQFEFLEQNKRNGFVQGKHGKRVADRAAEAAHAKGCLVLLKMGAYLDKLDDPKA